MNKSERKYIKQEKMILKLICKKGLMIKEDIGISAIGWASSVRGKKIRLRKNSKNKYNGWRWLSSLNYYTFDYWGEGDECSLIDMLIYRYWFESTTVFDDCGMPLDKVPTREEYIKYLRSLPNINNDSRINSLLKISYE